MYSSENVVKGDILLKEAAETENDARRTSGDAEILKLLFMPKEFNPGCNKGLLYIFNLQTSLEQQGQ